MVVVVTWTRVHHRVAQFWHTLTAPWHNVDEAYAARYLAPAELALFRRMPRAEQLHGIALAQALAARGWADDDLLKAALLHDVGKTVVRPRLWERVAVVLAEWLFPRHAARWAQGEARGWRRGFVIRAQHAAWGAELLAAAGASPRVVALVRAHHDPAGADAALVALQALDDGQPSPLEGGPQGSRPPQPGRGS